MKGGTHKDAALQPYLRQVELVSSHFLFNQSQASLSFHLFPNPTTIPQYGDETKDGTTTTSTVKSSKEQGTEKRTHMHTHAQAHTHTHAHTRTHTSGARLATTYSAGPASSHRTPVGREPTLF